LPDSMGIVAFAFIAPPVLCHRLNVTDSQFLARA
jgi:hypothetical protein